MYVSFSSKSYTPELRDTNYADILLYLSTSSPPPPLEFFFVEKAAATKKSDDDDIDSLLADIFDSPKEKVNSIIQKDLIVLTFLFFLAKTPSKSNFYFQLFLTPAQVAWLL